MNEEIVEFKLGDFTCWAINDFADEASPQEVFPQATEAEILAIAERFGFKPNGKIPQACTVLLIDTGKERILLDTGNGLDTGRNGRLFSLLERLGISRESIDLLVLSHAHSDHYSGIMSDSGLLNFPKAKHYIWREEWDFYSSAERMAFEKSRGQERYDFVQRYFWSIAPHWHFLDAANPEITAGVSAIPARGHTAQHCAIRLESGGNVLYFTADAFIHPAYIENPHWAYTSDFDAEATVASRKVLLKTIAAEKALLLAYHFPFPSLGHVVGAETGFCWEAKKFD